eukprot:TRINITY_DN2376_c0_g1_i1.p1 TRINITY_DN2376_c0_g1~~TRINITY_DN2376_c0_g1_i1.p1  ORF type:complete len:329 (-),score=64.19 TRINITY_DN2376_c0_g1_i1:259-1245(-)
MMLKSFGVRAFSSSRPRATKVAVLGAAGGIGQPLSLLLKLNPHVSDLTLFDLHNTAGIAADLSHISTPGKVAGFHGEDLGKALAGRDIVIIPAGVPRKPGMTRDDLFNTNARIVKTLAEAAATHCPKAHLLIISNPVNSTVPICAEAFKKKGVYDPRRLFGVTTLDVVRARTFVAEVKGLTPDKISPVVVGGHSGITIVPILSQLGLSFTEAEINALTHRIQFGGDEVVKAKAGTGSATLSMAMAGAEFAGLLIRALNGEKGLIAPSFVESTVASTPFFASPVELGKNGVERVHPIGPVNAAEQKLIDEALVELKKNIDKGVEFAHTA